MAEADENGAWPMTERINIEHGVPLPAKGDIKRRYPFRQMNIRDSFFVPVDVLDIKQAWNSLNRSRLYAQYKTGFEFTIRQVLGGLRVWRTK